MPTAEQMFRTLAEHSYAIEWITGNQDVPVEQRVNTYMHDLPAVWHEVMDQLRALDVMTVALKPRPLLFPICRAGCPIRLRAGSSKERPPPPPDIGRRPSPRFARR